MVSYPIVKFGTIEFGKEDIRTANIIEEFNPLSINVPVSRIELLLYSEDPNFSIINPSGDFELLKYRQPMVVYEVVGSKTEFIGQYYLDTWENLNNNQIRLNCMDEIGLLDTMTYRGGIWLTPITANDLLTQIFSQIDTQFDLDPLLEEIEITGWIPICSYREAIQQIAFAIGAYVLCARQNGLIKFGNFELDGTFERGAVTNIIAMNQSRVWGKRFRPVQYQFLGDVFYIYDYEQSTDRTVNLRPQVTGVEVSMHDITESDGVRKLFDGTLAAGTHEIQFSQPMHSLSVSGATITSSGANYAILSVSSTGAVYLEGKVYNDSISKVGVYMDNPSGIKENVLQVTEASLVNSINGSEIAQRIYDYYQKRYVQSVKLINPVVQVGARTIIDSLYSEQIEGVIEKMDTDLTGGFVSQVEIIGGVYESP